MRSLVQVDGHGLRVALCVFLAASVGACTQLKSKISSNSPMAPPRKPHRNKRLNESDTANPQKSSRCVRTGVTRNNA